MMPPRRSMRRHGVRSRRGAARARAARRSPRDPAAHELDQLVHVGRPRARLGDEEVGVLLGHDRAADAHALAAGGVDEAAGGIAGRVREHRARVLPARLVLAPPAHDLVDPSRARARDRRVHRRRSRPPRPTRGRQRRACGTRGRAAARPSSRTRLSPRSKTRAPRITSSVCAPWPPAFMRTAPPTEPGMPTKNSSPATPAAAVRRASTGRATAPPARTCGATELASTDRTDVELLELTREHDRDAGEAVVGDEQVRTAADHEHRERRRPRALPRPRGGRRRVRRAPPRRAGRRIDTS